MGMFRYTWRTLSREVALVVTGAIFFIPVYLMITMSLKTSEDVYTKPLAIPLSPDISNYSTAWKGGGFVSVGRGLLNSVIISVGSVACLIIIGSLCAWGLARRPSKLSTAVYLMFLLTIIVPFYLGVLPTFVAMRHLHLTGTLQGMIILNTVLLMPLTVFLYTGFIRSLPKEYEEAAQVDGAGLIRTFVRVVFPLLRPVTATVAVFTGLITWNEFFLPLIFLGASDNQTVPVALYSFVGEYTSLWNLIFASVVISITPVLAFYVITQRHLIRGFAGGIRG